MLVRPSHSLKQLNTFGLAAKAEFFAAVTSVSDLQELIRKGKTPSYILGGGSNILLTGDLQGVVVKNAIGGIEIVEDSGRDCIVAAGGGVNWHELVVWALERDLGGIENLSLIPGSCGAAPIQNIGAYGVELRDVFDRLEAVELATGTVRVFDRDACEFGYRNSVFKNELKGRYCITRIYLKLTRPPHTVRTDYGAIRETLREAGIQRPGIRDVSRAVIRIRRSKLPDPAVTGNAGSFFKNPEIHVSRLPSLQQKYPGIPFYVVDEDHVKIPAGWLIEQAGWKGKRFGDAGCHSLQALVLVNYGSATGEELLELSERICRSVSERFGIDLEREVNVW